MTTNHAVQKMIDSALNTLRSVDIDLVLSQRTYSDIELAIKAYYSENPTSRVTAQTLIGILCYMVSHRNNEFVSLSAISDAVGVKPGSLTR